MEKMMLLLLVIGLCVVAVVFTLFIGWLMDDDRRNKRELDDDTDTRLYVPSRCRNRGGDNRCDQQMDAETVINGLQSVRSKLNQQERGYLDYACDCVSTVDRLRKYIEQASAGE